MPKGLDPNASFRNPVDREALKQPAKILVECDLLELLIATFERQVLSPGSELYGLEQLRTESALARKAQNPGMRYCERCGGELEPREGHYCGEAQK